MALGLASRSRMADALPEFLATYSGDALWALLVFLGIGFLCPKWPTFAVGLAALVFAFGIELSQLYQADWINGIRATRPGALVLGAGFLWTDLLCYSVGIGVGVALESLHQPPSQRTSLEGN